jgi:two-component system, OmpR family, sensor kinase
MIPDRDNSARAWLALSCTSDGTIVQILHDDLGFARAAGTGAHLRDIVDTGSAAKAEKFIASLVVRESMAGWHLNIPGRDGAQPLYFAGAAGDDSLLILAAPDRNSAAALFDDLAGNIATSHALGNLLREPQTGLTASLSRDNELYEELSRLNNELINRERELARKSAALERLSLEKSRMVAIAAHDLRNPLTVIASYADLLKIDEVLHGEHLLYLDEIAHSARFMMELVEEMLDSSRLESGYVDVDLQELDLVAVADHAATINRIRAVRKQITITLQQEVDRAMIRADPVKLRQIINNLVVNAIKFSPERTNVTIRVRCTDGRALLEVEDQGIGIPRENHLTIFEPFKTLGAFGTAGERSTGLGLAIVKQLAALHHATIEVESEEGRGSLFRVAFPRLN